MNLSTMTDEALAAYYELIRFERSHASRAALSELSWRCHIRRETGQPMLATGGMLYRLDCVDELVREPHLPPHVYAPRKKKPKPVTMVVDAVSIPA